MIILQIWLTYLQVLQDNANNNTVSVNTNSDQEPPVVPAFPQPGTDPSLCRICKTWDTQWYFSIEIISILTHPIQAYN